MTLHPYRQVREANQSMVPTPDALSKQAAVILKIVDRPAEINFETGLNSPHSKQHSGHPQAGGINGYRDRHRESEVD